MSNVNSERYAVHMKTANNGGYRNLDSLIAHISILPERGDIYRGLEGRGIRKKAENLIARWNREDSINPDIVPLVAEVEEEYKFENGMEVPVGIIISSNGTKYKLESFRKESRGDFEICLMGGINFKSPVAYYNIPLINQQIQRRAFIIEDEKIREIPRVKKFLESYTNVTKSEEFKSYQRGVFNVIIKNGGSFSFDAGSTGNCQLTTLYNAQSLINYSSNIPLQLKEVAKRAGRRIVLMDIKEIYTKKLKDSINKNSILLSDSYRSTNGSKMHIILIDTSRV